MAVFCGFWRKFRHLVLVSMLCIGALFTTNFFALDDLNPYIISGYSITYYDGNTQMTPGSGWPIDYGRFDTNINLPNPTKSHYIFVGWCLNSSTCSESSRLMGTVSTSVFGGNDSVRLYAQWEQGDFRITTTSMPANSRLMFMLGVSGTFTVDCGDGGTLVYNGTSGGTTFSKLDTYKYGGFGCVYSTGGVKKITFSGAATGYSTDSANYGVDYSIRFYSNDPDNYDTTYIASVSGDISAVFPYLGSSFGQKPNFQSLFENAINLTSISGSLFQGYTTGDINFSGMFTGCTSLTSIPEDLFANMPGGRFTGIFYGCTGLTSIPSGLFSHMTTGDFANAFANCTGLTSLPSSLFANITNTTSDFSWAFQNCSNLTGFVPPTLFEGLINNGSPNDGIFMRSIFRGDSNLLTSCPANYYQYITGYESDWDGHVSCKPCPSGTTSPAGSTSINQCVYTITYNNGASSGMTVSNMPNPSSVSVAYGTSYTLASAPTSNGYVFVGWSCPGLPGVTQQNGYFAPGYSYAFNQSATCTAMWAEDRSITYLCGAGSGNGFIDQTTYTAGNDVTVSQNSNCSKTGSVFTGWLCDMGNNYIVYRVPGDKIRIPTPAPNNITCTASWMDMSCGNGGTVWVDPAWNEQLSQLHQGVSQLSQGTEYYPTGTMNVVSGGSMQVTSLCSSTPGTIELMPSDNVSNNQGGYCWCRITGYSPNGGSYSALSDMPFIYGGNFGSYNTCSLQDDGGCRHVCNKGVGASLTAQSGLLTRYACGYEVRLSDNTGNNDTEMSARAVAIYTIEGIGVYKDRARTQSMTPFANNVRAPTRQGNYNFDGYWSDSRNGTEYIDDSGAINNAGINAGKALTANSVWYAHWTPFYTITYYDQGTLLENNDLPANAPTTYTNDTTSLTLPTLSNTTGYTFDGWCDGVITCDANARLSGNINTTGWHQDKVFYAQWSCDTANNYYWDGTNCVKGYTITLTNSSGVTPDTVHSPSVLYTISGVGAYRDAARTELMTTSDYPITMPTKTITVLHDKNAPTNPVSGTPYNINVASVTDVQNHYDSFVSTDQPGLVITTIYFNNGLLSSSGDTIAKNLTADTTWYTREHIVTPTLFPVPSLPGYTFDGWYGNANGTGDSYASYSSSVPSTIYAHWTPNNYTVTYDCGNGTLISGQSSTYSATYDSNYSLASVASKCSYANHIVNTSGTNNISGWVCRNSGSNDYLAALSGVWQNDGNYTCVAQWKQNISYDCGTATTATSIPDDQVAMGDSYSLVSDTTNYCSTTDDFSGWACNYNLSTGASGTAFYNTSSLTGTFNVNADVECTAQWTEPAVPVYNITYYNGNTEYSPALTPGTYTPGSYIVLPTPSRTNGYIFAGWCDGNNNCTDFSTTLMGTVDTTGWTGHKQLYAKWIEDKFQIVTTTESSAFDFKFAISAAGLFFVDWGDGTVERIEKNIGETVYMHNFMATGSPYTIHFGGVATAYSNANNAVWRGEVRFGAVDATGVGQENRDDLTPTKIARAEGHLGAIFKTLQTGYYVQPSFVWLFNGAANLTYVSPTLFKGIPNDPVFGGVYGAPVYGMFEYAFKGCSSLTSIPSGLFDHIYGNPVGLLFHGTFENCSSLTAIPENLFKGVTGDPVLVGIQGAPARWLFTYTFKGCSALTSIPSGLFSKIQGAPAQGMFEATFMGCTGLTSIPEDLFSGISGNPVDDMFFWTFSGCTNVDYFTDSNGLQLKRRIRGVDNTPISYIPENYMNNITDTNYSNLHYVMKEMFGGTQLDIECPAGTYKRDVVFNTDWAPKVSCLICPDDGDSDAGSTSIDACTYNIVYDGLLSTDTWLNNVPAPTTYTYGAGQTISGTPLRSNYRFAGYCTDQARTDCALTQTIAQHLTGTKTFYLKFVPEYTITYYDGATDLGLSPSTYVADDSATLPSYSKPGYIFVGWCVGSNGCDGSNLNTTLQAGSQIPSSWTGNKDLYAKWVPYMFYITTVPNTTTFDFNIDASGLFWVDWGDGTIESFQGTADGMGQNHSHTYTSGGVYTIGLSSAGVTGYYQYAGAKVLSFSNTSKPKIAALSGSLGALFPTIGVGDTYATQPRFDGTFQNCTQLTSVAAGLFSGLHGDSAQRMFANLFKGCIGLTSIDGLFDGVNLASNHYMFESTFEGCTGLTLIPYDLFYNISGAPLLYMFHDTFKGCTNILAIPNVLFDAVSCDGLTTFAAPGAFNGTFEGCTGLTSIPYDLFDNIRNSVSANLFKRTFADCTGLRFIPENLFIRVSGRSIENLFTETFAGCTSVNSFANDSGVSTTAYIPTNYMNNITPIANYTRSAMVNIFNGTQLLVQCPANMFKHDMTYDVDWTPKVSCESCPNNGTSPAGSTSIDVCTYDINYTPLENGFTWTWQSNSNPPATYTYGGGATINSVPVHSGYVFDGYCTDSQGTSCASTQTIAAQESGTKTFYLKFHPVYNVTYDCNNGNAGGTAPTDSTNYAQGDTVTVTQNSYDNCAKPTNANGFNYWKCSVGGTDYTDDASDTSFSMPGADVACKAQWDYNTHTITLHSSDSCDYPQDNLTHTDTVIHGESYRLPSYGLVNDWPVYGCADTVGWNSDATSIQSEYSNGATISNITEDMDLYQVCTPRSWTAVYYPGTCSSSATRWFDDVYVYQTLPYTVTGPNSGPSIDAYYGQSHTNNWIAPQHTPNVGGTIYPGEGQAFVGWNYTDNQGTTLYVEGDLFYRSDHFNCGGNDYVEFYGVCVDAYSVSYRPNANSSVTYTESGVGVGTTHNLEMDMSVLNMTAPTGYHLDGWTCQTDANPAVSVSVTNNQITMPGNNVICTAEWALDEYHVTYDCYNGGLGTDPVDNTIYTIISNSATTPSQSGCLAPETGGRMPQSYWYCFPADETGQMIAGSSFAMVREGNTLTVNENKYCMMVWIDRKTNIILNAPTADDWTNKYLYGRYGYGAYLNQARTQLMSASENYLPNTHIPQRTGYNFDGYYSANQGNTAAAPTGTKYIDVYGVITSAGTDRAATITSDDNWYAGWVAKTYTVTYLPGDHGSISDDSYVHTNGATYNANYSVPAAATSSVTADTGYTFVGWNTVSGQVESNFPGDSETPWTRINDLSVYAAYDPITYNISYSLGTGGIWNEGQSHPTTADYDQVFSIGTPSRTGYTFNGWDVSGMDSTLHNFGSDSSVSSSTSHTTMSGINATYFKNLTSTDDATISFTAQWNTNQHSISYSCGDDATTTDAIPSSNNIAYGSSYSLVSDVYDNCEYVGYTFAGWECDYDLDTGVAGSTTYATDALTGTFNTDNDVECVAQWSANISGAITLNDDYYKTSSLNENNPTYTATTPVVPDVVYSVYNTGIYSSTADALAQTNALSYVTKPTLTGYDFQGFYTLRQCDTCTVNIASTVQNVGVLVINSNGEFVTPAAWTAVSAVNGTNTWYAKWTPKKYTVTYNKGSHAGNNVSNYVHTDGATYDQNYSIPADAAAAGTAATGYTFRGWSTDVNDEWVNGALTHPFTGATPWQRDSNLTVYAIYEPKQYAVSYYCDDVLTDSDNAIFGSSYTFNQTSICSKTGYTYGNAWVCEDSDTNTVNQSSNASSWATDSAVTCTVTSNPDEYNIAYDANGGTYTDDYTAQTNVFGPGVSNGGGTYDQTWSVQTASGAHIAAPACYTFRGWNENANAVYGTDTLLNGAQSTWTRTSDLQLYAIYDLNSHTVSYDCGSGSGTAPSGESFSCGDSSTVVFDGQGNCTAPSNIQEFGYWRCTGNTSSNILTSSDSDTYFTMPDEDVTCTAQWQDIVYNITYKDSVTNTGYPDSENLTPTTYTYGSTADLPTPTTQPVSNEHRIFAGWCLGANNCTPANTIYNIDPTWTGDKTLYAIWIASEFELDTIANTSSFQFAMSASGEYFIDWGDGTVERIVKDDTTTYTFPSHNYDTAGEYTIYMAGQATGYNTSRSWDATTIGFNASAAKVAAVRGSLGAIFSAIGNGGTLATQPRFQHTFENCTNLHSVPSTLFDNVGGSPVLYMFGATFANSGLTSLPSDLFRGVTGAPADSMFAQTFRGCTGLTSLPGTLFSSISSNGTTTNPAPDMFSGTFWGCTGLTSIPANLFSTIRGTPAENMFNYTFFGCSGLAPTQSNPNPVPATLFSSLDGAPAAGLFFSTFNGCTGLTSIPATLFNTIHGAPAFDMFGNTFSGCTNLQSIPSGLFSRISGAPAEYMFAGTFRNCSSIEEIPSGLFSGISGPAAGNMFSETFSGCTNLETIPNQLFGTLSGTAYGMFQETFKNCTSIETIPGDVFGGVSGAPDYYMFSSTFEGCTSLTSIPSDLFDGISGTPAQSMFRATFKGCTSLTSIPEDLFDGISGQSARYMFSETFRNCSNVQYFTDSTNQQVKAKINGNLTPIYYIPADYMEDVSENSFVNDSMQNMFAGTGLIQACPAGTTLRNTVFYTRGWTPKVSCVPTYTLTYDCNNGNAGGTVPAEPTVYAADSDMTMPTTNNTCNIPANAESFGYWLCSGSEIGDLTDSTDNTFTMPYENVTCSAQWNFNEFNINYVDSEDHNTTYNLSPSTYIVGSGDTITLQRPTRKTGKIFAGWCEDADDCDTSLANGTLMDGITVSTNGWTGDKTFYAMWVEDKFQITTTSLSANGDVFKFNVGAKGVFYIDCDADGDGYGTLGGYGTSGTRLDHSFGTGSQVHSCTYTNDGGVKTIRFGGVATEYRSGSTSFSINSNSPSSQPKVAALSGNLSAWFPYYGAGNGQYPSFDEAFVGCRNLTSIDGNLFRNYTNLSGATRIFHYTFRYCTGLTTIPSGLFSSITTGASNIFAGTFSGCTGLAPTAANNNNPIPSNLFAGITAGTEYMFASTFEGCTGLTSIPTGLFSNIITGASNMFLTTFKDCTNLTTIPSGLFNSFTTGASDMFNRTFYNCTGLTTIPSGFKFFANNVNGASYMFYGTFSECTHLTSIPSEIFSRVTTGADYMFGMTFGYCYALTSIPANLFATITTSGAYMYAGTFVMCSALTTIPSNFVFFANNVNGAEYMFESTFSNCSSLTSIPSGIFNRVTSGAQWIFNLTFAGCSGLTSIPSGLFTNITAASGEFNQTFSSCTGLAPTASNPTPIPYDLFANITTPSESLFKRTFGGCTGLTSVPVNLFATISGSPAQGMFYETFRGCSNIEYFADNSGNQLTEIILGNETEIDYIPKEFMASLEDPTYDSSSYAYGYQRAAYQMFEGTQLATSCPTGTTQRDSVFNDDWDPKVSCVPDIYLIWNAGGGQLGDAANNTNSCAYGSTGSINLINAPAQRPGYTFTGWTVTDWTDGAINNNGNNNNNDG